MQDFALFWPFRLCFNDVQEQAYSLAVDFTIIRGWNTK